MATIELWACSRCSKHFSMSEERWLASFTKVNKDAFNLAFAERQDYLCERCHKAVTDEIDRGYVDVSPGVSKKA